MPAKIDWTDVKLHQLTFIRPTIGGIKWEAQCDCGKITLARPPDVKRGRHKSCGCYALSGMIRRKHDPLISSAHKIWNCNYSDSDIDFDTFFSLSQKDCHYCGGKPATRFNRAEKNASQNQRENGWFIYNGLDRIDSKRPHMIDNVVPCCHQCNTDKQDLTLEQFISNVTKRYHHMVRLRKLGRNGLHQYDLSTIVLPTINTKNANRRKHHPLVSSGKKMFWSYTRDSNDNITFEQFFALSQQNCEYCGLQPSLCYNMAGSKKGQCNWSEYQKSNGEFIYNTLDRVNSNKGHVIDNVVPCCYDCNVAKSDWSLEEFVAHNARQFTHLFQ